MKVKYEDVRQKYIDAAILHKKSAYGGDSKTANKQYRVLKKIYEQMEKNIIEKDMLADLINHENISVRSWAASHMLGLKYEIPLAEKTLESIALQDTGMIGFSAEMSLKIWKKQGYVKF